MAEKSEKYTVEIPFTVEVEVSDLAKAVRDALIMHLSNLCTSCMLNCPLFREDEQTGNAETHSVSEVDPGDDMGIKPS